MHNASCIAGMAFTNAFLGVNHSIAHKLGGEFHIPHGKANAIILPYVIKYNGTVPTKMVSWPKYDHYIANERYAHLAHRLGLPSENVKEGVNSLVKAVQELNKKVGEEACLKDCGIDEDEFLEKVDILAEKAFEDQCTTVNPRVPLVSEIKQILIDAYYGNEISTK